MESKTIQFKRSALSKDDEKISGLNLEYGEPIYLDSENILMIGNKNKQTIYNMNKAIKLVNTDIINNGVYYNTSSSDVVELRNSDSEDPIYPKIKSADLNTYGGVKHLIKTNIDLEVIKWVEDSTYQTAGYLYKYIIEIEGCTSAHKPEIIFDLADASSGNLSPICETFSSYIDDNEVEHPGGIYVWAKSRPLQNVKVATIDLLL